MIEPGPDPMKKNYSKEFDSTLEWLDHSEKLNVTDLIFQFHNRVKFYAGILILGLDPIN